MELLDLCLRLLIMVEVKLNIRRKQNQKLTEAKINKNPILVA